MGIAEIRQILEKKNATQIMIFLPIIDGWKITIMYLSNLAKSHLCNQNIRRSKPGFENVSQSGF